MIGFGVDGSVTKIAVGHVLMRKNFFNKGGFGYKQTMHSPSSNNVVEEK